jgi:hypothetical protein
MINKLCKYLKLCFFTTLLLFGMYLGFSQQVNKELKIVIVTNFNGEIIEKDKWYVTATKDSIQFSKLKFYLTNFVLQGRDYTRDTIADSNYLIDAFKKETMFVRLSDVNYSREDKLILNIGVDDCLNTSGAHSGDLDPMNGMYWSWQSGYINFKIEGKSPSCNTRKNKFQFHIGGYQKPYETIRRLVFKLNAVKDNTLRIDVDVSHFFRSIQLSSQNQIMIPGKDASNIADRLTQMFSIHD